MKDNEREPWPRGLIWLLVFLIPLPFGPWWLTIPMLTIIVTVIVLGVGRKAKNRNSE